VAIGVKGTLRPSALALFLLATGLMLYLALPFCAAPLINRFLLPGDVTLQRLNMGYPGWQGLDLVEVELSGQDIGRIRFEQVELNYHWRSLINGRIDRLIIKKLSVAVPEFPVKTEGRVFPGPGAPESPFDFASFLPSHLLAQLPLSSFTVNTIEILSPQWPLQLSRLSAAFEDQQLTVNGELVWPHYFQAPLDFQAHLDQQNQWQLSAYPASGANKAALGAMLVGTVSSTTEEITVALLPQSEVELPGAFLHSQATGKMALTTPTGLALTMPRTAVPESWLLQGAIAGRYSESQRELLVWTLGNPTWNPDKRQLQTAFTINTQLDNWRQKDPAVDLQGIEVGLEARLEASLRDQDQSLRVEWSQPQQMGIAKAVLGQQVAEKLQLILPPQSVSLKLPKGEISPLQATLGLASLQSVDKQIALQRFSQELTLEMPDWQTLVVDAAFSDLPLRLENQPLLLPAMHLGARLDLSAPTAKASFQLENACRQTLLSGQWQQNASGQQQLTGELHYTYSPESSLRRRLNFPGLNFDLLSGTLAAQFSWQVTPTGAPSLNLSGKGLSGYLPDGSFSGVQLRLSSSSLKSQLSRSQTAEPRAGELFVALRAEELAIGVTASGAKLEGVLRKPARSEQWQLLVERAEADLLGGRIRMHQQRLNFGIPSTLIVEVDKLDLSHLIETQQLEGVAADGLISGSLPVTLRDFVPSISGGFVQAVEEGVIQYHSPLGTEGLNPDLKVALDVLKNFNYRVLESSVEYTPEGSLKMTSRIEGSNPDVAGGKQVNLNLNTELDLKSALYALRLQSGLDQRLIDFFGQQSVDQDQLFCKSVY